MPSTVENLMHEARNMPSAPAPDRDRVHGSPHWMNEYADYARLSKAVRSHFPHHLDLRYGADARQIIDVYLPQTRVENAPVLVFFHGGALVEGHPRRYAFVARPYLERGAIVVLAGYRLLEPAVADERERIERESALLVHQLGNEAPAELTAIRRAVARGGVDAAEDGRVAIAWIHHNVSAFGGDPDRIVVAGHSSGAMISVATGASTGWQKDLGIPEDTVKGIVPIGGRYGLWLANAIIGGGSIESPPHEWHLGRAPAAAVVFGEEEYDDIDDDGARATDCAVIGRTLIHALRHEGASVAEVALPPCGHWQTVRSLGDDTSATATAVYNLMGMNR